MSEQVKSWSTFELKSVDDESRTIRGIASTPTTDRAGDIVEPKGAKFVLPLPLLSQHRHDAPIGHVTNAKVTSKGIEIEASIPKDTGLDYVETAWKQIKAGLIRGLSIGFRGITVEPIKGTYGVTFKEWEWYELSAVTIPCNSEANILAVKQFDEQSTSDANNPGEPSPNGEKHVALLEHAAAVLKKSADLLAN